MNRVLRHLCTAAVFLLSVSAHAALTVTPITWNIIGLDSNDQLTGPNTFPVGARVCSDVATTNVTVNFVWDSANANINLRSGTAGTLLLPAIGAGGCADAYFEVEVTRTAAAFDTTRRYHITATDGTGTASTPTPRELYVEHLISQNRNSITDVKFGTTLANVQSVPAGGSMAMVVGETYIIQLFGGTATQGYEQFEAFINFPNTIFQILDVETTYSANTSAVPNPNDKLYADACVWENDPNNPNYRACVGGGKAGGSNVVTTYTIRIISGGGTSQTLNTLLYDFSGSSFHYNADYSTGARIATVVDPSAATIVKSFSPNPAPLNGTSVLTITLTNPNAAPLGGYNFVDNLPANLVVAASPSATTNGCGTPTLTAVAGSSTISFSNGTLAANSNCVITVNVTPTATGTLTNTTNNLFIGTTDTGKNASADLTVNTAPPPGTGFCGLTLAGWTFPVGFSVTSPAPTTDNAPGTPSAQPGDGVNEASFTEGTNSWGSNGGITTGGTLVTANEDYLEFAVDTTGVTSLQLTFDAARKNTPNSPTGIAVFAATSALPTDGVAGNGPATEPGTAVLGPNASALPTSTTAFTSFGPISLPNGTTHVRIYFFASGNDNSGSDAFVDNVTFTGCATPVQPTIAKSFSPDPIAVGAVSTLTFTLTNTNATPLTGAAFTDSLPAGVQVAATPAAATTCGGTWAPAAGATSLTFSGGTIPASSSCTVSVAVTATTAGPHTNVSGFLSTTESGTNTSSVATATLTAIVPPSIDKLFDPNPIIPGGISTLTFTIANGNQDDPIAGVAFSDTFPVSPGAMTVAAVPNATTSGCGSPTFSPAPGAGSISFSGGSIAAGGLCVVTVDVTASALGTYNNTTGNVSHIVNGVPVNGNTASDSLTVVAPNPSIALLKQVGPTATGPWSTFLGVASGAVHFRFTIENTGDVPLTPISLSDNTLDVSSCNTTLASTTLPAPVAANENHIVQCVVGPVAVTPGSHTNTAFATGMFSATPVVSPNDSATFATTGLTLDKTASPTTFLAAGNVINYSYLVTNSGFAPLEGPVTVTDDRTTATCPAVNTVGDLDNFLDPGESITCTATYTITAADVAAASVTNTATASADGVNSNSDSATVFLATAADVSVVKTLTTAGPFTAGQSITYSMLVANAGPATATNIQVTDTPTNLTITNVSGACVTLPCTIPTLLAGANTTITVTATITANGAFDNVVTVAATEPDPNPANNTDNTGNGGTAGSSADVSVVKTLTTAGPFTEGQSVTYTLFVANAGPSTATNVQVTDTPTNLTITSVSGGGCTALPCTIPSLTSGANTTITVTATINAAGAFDNAATVSATETDPVPSNNTDNTGNNGTAGPSADVSVVKTLTTAGPFTAGQSVTYTLFVANAGPSTATNVQVTDTPTNLTITTVSGGGCAALPCTIPSLASGANTTITVTATINTVGAFDNAATVSATETDPVPSNNTDNTGNGGTTGPSADVSVVKTLTTAGPYTVGQSVTYTLFVANAGPSTATNVQVTDTPTNLTITSVSGGGCAALPCTIPSLASGANTTITVTATINAAGAFDNVATVSATETDPVPSNNTDNTGNNGTADPSADVSLVKTLTTAGPYSAGQSITYTLDVANAGPSTATNVNVTDTPTNLTITSVSGGGCAALPCTIPTLTAGASTAITVTATITAAGAFDNSATATAVETDPNTANNTDNTGNNGITGASADVTVVKTLTTPGPYSAGQSITYTLVIGNAGPSPATNLVVTDTPTNLTITSVSGGGCATLPCTIPNLAVGGSVTITITATINATGAFDNVAVVDAAEPDPNPANNIDDTGNNGVTAPPSSADVSITKTASVGAIVVGQQVDFILTVRNNGPGTATNVVVTDALPANFSLISASSTQGTCSGTTTVTCNVGTMLSGATVTITIRGTVTTTPSMSNTASVTATETDPVPGNNVSTLSLGPPPAGIPTASEWGLLMMALLLAIGGALVMRR